MEEEPESARTCEKISGERVDGSLITQKNIPTVPGGVQVPVQTCSRAHLQDGVAAAAPALVSV